MLTVQMYAKKPLPRTFKLSGDPYSDSEARKELLEMGVFFYRDETRGSRGVVLELGMSGLSYYQQVLMNDTADDGSLEVDEWNSDALNEPSGGVGIEDVVSRAVSPAPKKDLYAWVVHNQPVNVIAYDPTKVQLG